MIAFDYGLRTGKEKMWDFMFGILLVIWYIITVTFPAFHFSDFETKKSVVVALVVPPFLLIMVFSRVFKKKKSYGNLWTIFFFPEFQEGTYNKADLLLSYAIGWCGILLAPSLGSYSAEKFIYGSTFNWIYWAGVIPVIIISGIIINYRLNAMALKKARIFYVTTGTLLSWWSWAELLNIIEIYYRAPWVLTDMPDRLESLLGI